MDDRIFKSVIEITEQKDLDSLESSLIATLAELCELSEISIIRIFDHDYRHRVEESIRLDIIRDSHGKRDYQWNTQGDFIKPDESLIKCIETKQKSADSFSGKFLCYQFPIIAAKEVIGVLRLCGSSISNDSLLLIEGFVKIYENYLFILNESERDKLTGLLNRRTFDKKLARLLQMQREAGGKVEAQQARRALHKGATAWLVIIDVDHFKAVNDKFGHVYGDEVLLHLSRLMKSFFRSSDLLFRFGGEEFVLVLEPIPKKMADTKLNAFRHAVSEYQFPLVGNLTISAGYIAISEADYPLTALDNADKALYHAKSNGRDQIACYEDLVLGGVLKEVEKEVGEVDLF
jgi:diguanylate cyclase (GGDEF)-like protein